MPKTSVRTGTAGRPSLGAQALAAVVARRFFVEGLTKVEIARQLGISRFKVARLLTEAQESGLVQIQVVTPSSLDGDLAEAVRAEFGLRAAYVVRTGRRRWSDSDASSRSSRPGCWRRASRPTTWSVWPGDGRSRC